MRSWYEGFRLHENFCGKCAAIAQLHVGYHAVVYRNIPTWGETVDLLVPQCGDRIEAGGAQGGQHAGGETDKGGRDLRQ